ncbi:ATP dependent DNA ligase [Bradyrhizobium sp. JR3.5]
MGLLRLDKTKAPRCRAFFYNADRHKGIWVEPKLLAEIEYRAKSAEGKVRHPFIKGLREDL